MALERASQIAGDGRANDAHFRRLSLHSRVSETVGAVTTRQYSGYRVVAPWAQQ